LGLAIVFRHHRHRAEAVVVAAVVVDKGGIGDK
jgi:hypothetical protein